MFSDGQLRLYFKDIKNAGITATPIGYFTVDMSDYGSFEKVGSLERSLPTNDQSITTEAGDVILYQGNQITIYYDTNTWNFTRLGKVQGLSAVELKEVLGDGSVSVRFSLD